MYYELPAIEALYSRFGADGAADALEGVPLAGDDLALIRRAMDEAIALSARFDMVCEALGDRGLEVYFDGAWVGDMEIIDAGGATFAALTFAAMRARSAQCPGLNA